MTEAETVARLVELLTNKALFLHTRFGDGDVFFATKTGPVITGDGEEWCQNLHELLIQAWFDLAEYDAGVLLLGDLESYAVSDGCEEQWRGLLSDFLAVRGEYHDIELVHMEALRVGFGCALPFYLALRDDPRDKLYVAPERLKPMADLLGCRHLGVPLGTAWEVAEQYAAFVKKMHPKIVLFSAGRGGKIMQGWLTYHAPEIIQIDIGSGLDLLIEDGVRRGTDLAVNRRQVVREYREAGLAP